MRFEAFAGEPEVEGISMPLTFLFQVTPEELHPVRVIQKAVKVFCPVHIRRGRARLMISGLSMSARFPAFRATFGLEAQRCM